MEDGLDCLTNCPHRACAEQRRRDEAARLAARGPGPVVFLVPDGTTQRRVLSRWPAGEYPAAEVRTEASLLVADLGGALGRDLPRGAVFLKWNGEDGPEPGEPVGRLA